MAASEIELDNLVAGDDVATDLIASKHYQHIKMTYGAAGTANEVTSTATNPFPVALSDVDNAVLDTINTAVETIDNAVSGAGFNITQMGGVNLNMGEGIIATGTQRVSIATDDDAVAHLASIAAAVGGNYAEDAAHTTGDEGIFTLAVRNDSLAALAGTDGDYAPFQVDANGSLYVTGGGGGTEYTEGATDATITGSAVMMEVAGDALEPIQGTVADGLLVNLGSNNDVSVSGTVTVDLGANNDVTVTSGAITETNSAAILADTASMDTNLGTLAGAISGTEMQTDIVSSALPTGAATAANQLPDGHNVTIDNASVTVDLGVNNDVTCTLDAETTKIIGTVNIAAGQSVTADLGANNDVTVTSGTITANLGATDNAVLDDIAAKLAPNSTNGHSFYLNQDTNAVASVKASAGTIYWISCQSTDATPVYLNLYNVASGSVTLGTTTPSMQFIIPSQGDANGSGLVLNFGPLGIQFGTAITVAAATTFNGSTDPGANVVITNIGYE